METPLSEILQKAVENQRSSKPFVMATVVVGADKTPGRSGFKLLSYADGNFEGTVGGGKLERMVLEKCKEIHKTGLNGFEEYKLTEEADGIGMVCGGIAKVFFEFFSVRRKIFIFGAGHLCRSILPVLKSIGFYITIIDNRVEYASQEKLPDADEVLAADYLEYVSSFEPHPDDAVIIFTHGHLYDFDILDHLCKRDVKIKYVGMIGSKLKVAEAIAKIKQNNYKSNLLNQLHAPIGLNIGKETTQEIAVAITAEILAVYNDVKKVDFLSRSFRQTID
ncbi:XdhC family protein [Candidatus Cloacimonadota bacterium]